MQTPKNLYLLWLEFEIFYTLKAIQVICWFAHTSKYKTLTGKGRSKYAILWKKSVDSKAYNYFNLKAKNSLALSLGIGEQIQNCLEQI